MPDAGLLVCYPVGADVDARTAAGAAALRAALAAQGRTAKGPVTAQPFVHLQEGAPDDSKLATAKVRVAVRVE